jgi:hypothetical protein
MEIVETTEAGPALLDAVIKKLNLKHDAALSRRLSVNPAVIKYSCGFDCEFCCERLHDGIDFVE